MELEISSLAATLPGAIWCRNFQTGLGYYVESSRGTVDRSYCPLLRKAGGFSLTVSGRIFWASCNKFFPCLPLTRGNSTQFQTTRERSGTVAGSFKEGKVAAREAPSIKDGEGNENRSKAVLLRTSKYLAPWRIFTDQQEIGKSKAPC